MSRARTTWVSGPVLRAQAAGPFALREAVRIGPAQLLGEVVRIHEDEIVAQVYEDTTGLRPGIDVLGTGELLSVRLGPALLGGIFDGLLRPLTARPADFRFVPRLRHGERAAAGSIVGEARPEQGPAQVLLVPPNVDGEVETICDEGVFADDAPLCRVRDASGQAHEIAMSHRWPVRTPRPVRERLPADEPLVTGQRILDSLFPVALGSSAALPGGFGTGKTILLETLAKACSADVIVYLGCGERGNEMAGVLEDLPRLTDPRSGRPLMERTVILANTSNMPVAAREASIYSAATVAEYFRDQGLHVALMADSTSRWAEALREVSGRFGELPGEGGYPAYLSSRIAEFYERAAKVRTLSGAVGSLTLLGSVSPPSGDFSEPVTSHTRRYVRSLWALDAKRAHARFYPAIDPLQSYSEDAADLAPWWQQVYGAAPRYVRLQSVQGNEWEALRRRFLTLLDEQARLERMARIIGKDALPPRQQLTLFCAELINEAFLRQSAFSDNDRSTGAQRQALMMRAVAHFIELAEKALAAGVPPERIATAPVVRALQRMGEDIAEQQPQAFQAVAERIEADFAALCEAGERKVAGVAGVAGHAT